MKEQKQKTWPGISGIVLLIGLGTMSYLLVGSWPGPGTAAATYGKLERRINIPYLGAGPPAESFEPAIFWFGQVTPTINNADVRLWYYDEYMKVTVHIIDRRLWYDRNPSPVTLEEWDAVSLFLHLDGNHGDFPTSDAYRLVAQLNWWEADDKYQVAYRGNGSTWVAAPVSFTAKSEWRGGGPNNNDADDKGWQVTFTIPFASLGLSGPPAQGKSWGLTVADLDRDKVDNIPEIADQIWIPFISSGFSGPPAQGKSWGLAVAVHDRDDADGNPAIADQVWPEMADFNVPATWGEMNFGIPVYSRPVGAQQGITTIRQGLNGAEVPDGHVGGHGNCGAGLDHWTEWGEMNYVGYDQINIQNQWDISDYPCFSKYFVTFPLDTVPPGKTILGATLSMTMFGNAGGGEWGIPEDSFIQVLTVAEDWDEQTLNWNNAPLAMENISGTWVKPVQTSDQRNYDWDVSRAVAGAYQTGQPLRLALYTADGERHSGKYFWSSEARVPALKVIWGAPGAKAGVE